MAIAPLDSQWQQGQLVELTITDLTADGDGVGRAAGDRVVFVPDTLPGDRLVVRLVQVKPRYARGKQQRLLENSPHRVRPRCIVADKCGGCQWQHIAETYQLEAKQGQVVQALKRIGGFPQPPVQPILASPTLEGYRNKATYPVGLSPSHQVKVGYYRKGSHQIVNLNQCPVQDERLNPLLANIKGDIQAQGWSIYNEQTHTGKIRHLALRIGQRTGEILLTLVVRDWDLPQIATQAAAWMQQYPKLVGVLLNRNGDRTNVIFGPETRCVVGQSHLREKFAGLNFQIHPATFFQIHTEQAEVLLQVILATLNLQGQEAIVDAYCGIGTLSLPLAQQSAQVIGLEMQPEAVQQARQNAEQNGIDNVTFQVSTVAEGLTQLPLSPDIVVLDPPRKGCGSEAIASLLALAPPRIVYVSCKPATLARDLKHLCQDGPYQLVQVQPIDFFPQTAHVECVAFLEHQET